jgi:hypothetical protein
MSVMSSSAAAPAAPEAHTSISNPGLSQAPPEKAAALRKHAAQLRASLRAAIAASLFALLCYIVYMVRCPGP